MNKILLIEDGEEVNAVTAMEFDTIGVIKRNKKKKESENTIFEE